MEMKTVKCCWCGGSFFPNEMAEIRFLGGLDCQKCDADEGSRTLGDIHARLKERSGESIDRMEVAK